MTTTTTIRTDNEGRFLGYCYERLRNSAEIIASDPAVENSDALMNGEALRIFIDGLANELVLDGLSDMMKTPSPCLSCLISCAGRNGWPKTHRHVAGG